MMSTDASKFTKKGDGSTGKWGQDKKHKKEFYLRVLDTQEQINEIHLTIQTKMPESALTFTLQLYRF